VFGHKRGPQMAAMTLEPDDIAALQRAVEKLAADPELLHNAELQSLKESPQKLVGVIDLDDGDDEGGSGSAAAATKDANGRPCGAEPADSAAVPLATPPPALAPSPPVVVGSLVSDSDTEGEARPKEFDFGIDLKDELEDEKEEPLQPGQRRVQDMELLPRDAPPFPLLPPSFDSEPSNLQRRALEKAKQQAAGALEKGDVRRALENYTKAIRTGGASALMLATRAGLLLKLNRPCASIRDCCVALKINDSLGKAYRIRGTAHRRLGHYQKAHRDLAQAQKLDYDEATAVIHRFVCDKIGLVQDLKTGVWYKQEGAKNAVQLLFGADADKGPRPTGGVGVGSVVGGAVELRAGQAVRVDGLQKAPHLNLKRGVVQRHDPASHGRWEVELRLDEGRLEVKSIRGENLLLVKADDGDLWREEEERHAQDRKRREEEEKRRREQEQEMKRKEQRKKDMELALKQDGIPDMDASELVEAEMSTLPLSVSAQELLRGLPAETALDILQQVDKRGEEDLSEFVVLRSQRALGGLSDSDVELQEGDDEVQEVAEPIDPELMKEETEPFPPMVLDANVAPSEEKLEQLARAKHEAAQALEVGDVALALEKYTEAIQAGGATALTLAKRGELLLKQRRPCAAIRDCSAALEVNPDCGKAYRVRGVAHRRLGHWHAAHRDLAQGQKLDFDDATVAVQTLVAQRMRVIEERAVRRKRRGRAAAWRGAGAGAGAQPTALSAQTQQPPAKKARCSG